MEDDVKEISLDVFRNYVIRLYHYGKSRTEIIEDFNLTPATFDSWVRDYINYCIVDDNDD